MLQSINRPNREIVNETLEFVAQRGWQGPTDEFFRSLVTHLGQALDVAYVLVGRLTPGTDGTIETIALYANGAISPNIEYPLAGTPCENVVATALCSYRDKIQKRFPEDTLLTEMRAESYSGIPLWAGDGSPLGIVAIVDVVPFENQELVETLLQIVSLRAAAELDRQTMDAELQDSHQRLHDFATASSDWFWEMDENLRYTWFSPDVERITGVPAEWHYGKTREEIGAPDVPEAQWAEHIETLRRHEPFKDFVFLRRGPDGDKWLRSSGLPIFDQAGRFRGYRGTGTDLTATVEAQKKVEYEQMRFKDAVEGMSDGFALFDPEDRLIFCNTMFKELNPDLATIIQPGMTFEKMLRDNIRNGRIVDAFGREEDFIRERMERHRNPTEPVLTQRKDGRWLLLREKRTADGCTFLVNTDLTEVKRHEESLAKSEARFRDFAELSADFFWEMNADLEFSYVSSSIADLGVSPQAVLGKRRDEIRPPGLLRPIVDDESDALRARQEYREIERPSDVAANAWVSVSGRPLLDASGIFAGFRGVTRNITEKKHAEQKLEESRRVLESILNALPMGLTLVDRVGRLMFANHFEAGRWGFNEKKTAGRSLYSLLPPEVAEKARSEDRLVVESGTGIPFFEETVTKNDQETTMLVGKIPIKNKAGEVTGVCTMALDISSRIAAEKSQKESIERLQRAQKMEAVGQLTGGVAHDFNNLLAVIQGNAELLSEKYGVEETKMQAILRASARGAELTQRLLAYSRQQPLQPRPTDLVELVENMRDLLQPTLGETIVFETVSADGLAPVMADPGQVENAILNLAINARDAMPDGGRLTITCTQDYLDAATAADILESGAGRYVVLAMRDTGSGMTSEVRAHAFEPFFTTKEVGQGSGLGLSMVYGFVKQSGGGVSVESEEGMGTTVKLYLPPAEELQEAESTPNSGDVPHGQGEVVLVIEDDPDVRSLTVQMLSQWNYRVVEAADGAKAQALLANGEPVDLVLSDVVLPGGMSGPDFAKLAGATHPGLKVLFMSGYPMEAAQGFNGQDFDRNLLNKPFRSRQLARAVHETLTGQDPSVGGRMA